jgi:pyruvate,water dikinase
MVEQMMRHSSAPGTDAHGLVNDLAELRATDITRVGGKAANLGELIGARFDVPEGFCVTTAAYRAAVCGAGVQDGHATDPAAARAAVLASPIPADIADAIRHSYQRLGSGAPVPVAVRSSATAEDLPGASFAGQQDTYLDVIGIDQLLDAVRRCWASLWTDRAVAYRAAQGIGSDGLALAVVVQRMVPARAAGVLFTADPVTGRRRCAVIDAAPGLGDAVVSGSVDPDHFVVETATGAVIERRHGGAPHFCLADPTVRELAALGDQIEQAFGAPQDIEWAIDASGRIWVVQSRPITTLFPVPQRRTPTATDDVRAFFCVSLAQGLHRPITPIGIAAFRVMGSAFLGLAGYPPGRAVDGPDGFAVAAQRVFVDATPALRSRVGREIMPRALDVMEARSAVVMRRLFDDPRFAPLRGSVLRSGIPLARVLLRCRVPVSAAQALISPAAAHRRINRMLRDVGRSSVGGGDISQRVDSVVRLLGGALPSAPRVLPSAAAGFAALGVAARLLRGSADRSELEAVLRSAPGNVTTEMDLELWQIAATVRRDASAASALRDRPPAQLADDYRAGTLPPVLHRGMTGFLERYGQRAVAEIDLGMPRWSDDPAHLFGVLAGYLQLDDETRSPDEHFRRGDRQAVAMVAALTARARQRGRLRGMVVGFCLRRARSLVGLREMPKFLMITAFGRARAALAQIGGELAAAGAIHTPDDVFFLDFDEIARAAGGADLRGRIADRRRDYDAELGRRHVPRVVLSDGTEPEAVAAARAGAPEPGLLTGTPASAGVVTAAARVILDPAGASLLPGEILVAPSTDPGWTPLFLTAGGLVMEMGGANSHGAVVAREYGIPAVVGVAGATTMITTGSGVTVDGAGGTVRLAGVTSDGASSD